VVVRVVLRSNHGLLLLERMTWASFLSMPYVYICEDHIHRSTTNMRTHIHRSTTNMRTHITTVVYLRANAEGVLNLYVHTSV
jgi:hypothetical protein